MSGMVERVARAMWERRSGTFPPNVQAMENPWTVLIGEARDAIQAMREPTEAMLLAGEEQAHRIWVPGIAGVITQDDLEEEWRAMINAALD